MACFGPFYQGAGYQVIGFPVLVGMTVEVGNAAVLGNQISWRMWEANVGKLVMDSLKG
jgi:hypothetical protein